MVNFGLSYQYRYQPSPYSQPYQYPLPISIFRGEPEMILTYQHFVQPFKLFCPDFSYHYYDVWRKCSRFVADDPHNSRQQARVHKKLDHLNLQVLKAINIRKTGQDIENGKATWFEEASARWISPADFLRFETKMHDYFLSISQQVDTELEAQIEGLRDTQRKYANILRLARALTSHFHHVVQVQVR